ncbi:hypothetical protein [Neogemmobacter tilapiae]|uniref:Uncharacterized protein n=1 Tax=Neogemmobacter tilapiae TaxID=875041 RepID=A0A918WK44_9RHOB|nr:hypothetical protein [Gemmobacter tilapiae]GHC53722.1 hypothetical protein GCM10007315_15600 [Gemmobacter tilapiae]
MDYSKSGGPKTAKNPTRHQEGKPSGKAKPPGGRLSKQELLARMKAATEAKKPV